ncbi:MAG: CDP-alcohol phosphatidyltransferase family protein [Candidatus Diapherotrites archaeon]|nr:CDP-alcohol phosphatidyltransferase family protein [Candidatus Diapherotrites archaeon]
MLGQLRTQTQKITLRIGQALAFIPLSPNQFTLLAIPLAATAAYFISRQEYGTGLLFVLLTFLMDGLDGSFAQARNQKTIYGNYLDAMTDRAAETIIFLGLALQSPFWALAAYGGNMLVSYAKPRVGLVIETDNHDWPAIGERADRAIILCATLVAAAFIPTLNGISVIEAGLMLLTLVTFIGLIQRMQYARTLIKKAETEGKILSYLRK